MLADRVYDNGLTVLDTEANALHICTQDPTSYAEATSTYSLGNKTGISVGAPQAGTPNGREVVVAAISDGEVTGDGVVTHYAIVDTSNSRLLVTGQITGTTEQRTVGDGNTFTLPTITIRIPAPA